MLDFERMGQYQIVSLIEYVLIVFFLFKESITFVEYRFGIESNSARFKICMKEIPEAESNFMLFMIQNKL